MVMRIQFYLALVVLASGCTMDFTAVEERDDFACEVKADCLSGYECVDGKCARQPAGGDPLPGDPMAGDPMAGDPVAGDPVAGDPVATGATHGSELCAAGGPVSSAAYRGYGCLSPVSSSGHISTNNSYKLIPGPAHIVEVE